MIGGPLVEPTAAAGKVAGAPSASPALGAPAAAAAGTMVKNCACITQTVPTHNFPNVPVSERVVLAVSKPLSEHVINLRARSSCLAVRCSDLRRIRAAQLRGSIA